MSLPKESMTGAWKDAPPVVPIKDKAAYEKWTTGFTAWVEASGAASTILATYNLSDKELGTIFVSRFKNQSSDYIMTIPISGYVVGEEGHDVAGLAQREQSLSIAIQEAAIKAGVEEKFDNLLLTSKITQKKTSTKSEPSDPSDSLTDEQKASIQEQLLKAGTPLRDKGASSSSSTTSTTLPQGQSGSSKTSRASSGATKAASPKPTSQIQEMSKEFLDILGLTTLDKRLLSTKAPLWIDVATWTREKSTFMHARIAIWNYMNRCLTGTPYAHALNTVEVYDVRGLYSKMKGLLNKCTLMTLSVTTISLFKLMSECSATKDPAVYYSELTEKATLVEEMARQVDKDSGTNATGGFIIPKFLITVSLIHALNARKDMQGLVQDLLRKGDLGNITITPEEMIKQAQQYQANVRAINPKMGATGQHTDSFETMSAEDAKSTPKDACHRNYNGRWCDESRCRFKHYKPSAEKPEPSDQGSVDFDRCSGCGKDKHLCPSRDTCSAKDILCGHCQIKGHHQSNCKKKAAGKPAVPPQHAQTKPPNTPSVRGKNTKGRGRGGKSRGRANVTFQDHNSDHPPDFDLDDEGEDIETAFHSSHAQSMYGSSTSSIVSRPKSAANGIRIGEASHPGPPTNTNENKREGERNQSPPSLPSSAQTLSTNDSEGSDSNSSKSSTSATTKSPPPFPAQSLNLSDVAQALRNSSSRGQDATEVHAVPEETMQRLEQQVEAQNRLKRLQRSILEQHRDEVGPALDLEDQSRLQRIRHEQGKPCSNGTCARYGNYQCGNCSSRYCSKSCQLKDARKHQSSCFKVAKLIPVTPDEQEAEGRGDTLGLETPRLLLVPVPDQRHPQDVIGIPYLEIYSFSDTHKTIAEVMSLLAPTADPSLIHQQRMHLLGRFISTNNPFTVEEAHRYDFMRDSTQMEEVRLYFRILSESNLFHLSEIYSPWGRKVFDTFASIFELYSESDKWQRHAAMYEHLTSQFMLEAVSSPSVRAPLNARIITDARNNCTWPYLKSVSIHSVIRFHADHINRIARQEIVNSSSVHPGTFFLHFLFRDFPIISGCLQKIKIDEIKSNNMECHLVLLDKLADYSQENKVNLLCLAYPEELFRDVHLKLEVWGNCDLNILNNIFARYDSFVSATAMFDKVAELLYSGVRNPREDPDSDATEQRPIRESRHWERQILDPNQKEGNAVTEAKNSLLRISDYALAMVGDPDFSAAVVGQFSRCPNRGRTTGNRPQNQDDLKADIEQVVYALSEVQKTLFGFDQLTAYNFDNEGSTSLDLGETGEPDLSIRFERSTLRAKLLKEKETGETFNRAINYGVTIDRRFECFRLEDEVDFKKPSGAWVRGTIDAISRDQVMVLHLKNDDPTKWPHHSDSNCEYTWTPMDSENIAPSGTRCPIKGYSREFARKDAPQPVLPKLPKHYVNPYVSGSLAPQYSPGTYTSGALSPQYSPGPRYVESEIALEFILSSEPPRFEQTHTVDEENKNQEKDFSIERSQVPLGQFLRHHEASEIKVGDLQNFLTEVKDGLLDHPTPEMARVYSGKLRRAHAWSLSFRATMTQWEIEPGELPKLASPSAAYDTFAFYLPAGAQNWVTKGSYSCDTCYMHDQPTPVSYAQHVSGEPHVTRLERFIAYLEAPASNALTLCKICLKIIDPNFTVKDHDNSKKHKRAMARTLAAKSNTLN